MRGWAASIRTWATSRAKERLGLRFRGAPWRTQEVVRRIQNELYSSKPNGLPGNDDAGAMSSWLVFSALGLYPEIPGVAGFTVGSPVFQKASIHFGNGKTLVVTCEQASEQNPYVQSVEVKGQALQGPWIPWSALENGAYVHFDVGPKASRWGSDPKFAPPSFDD